MWNRLTGHCTMQKINLDQCFRDEKKRMLEEMNKGLTEERKREGEIIMKDFGRDVTFEEYLKQDQDYQNARKNKC